MTDPHVLDPEALERLREWGGEKLLAQMVRLFLQNAPQRMDQVRSYRDGGDGKEAERGAHSLKSSAANVGARRVRELAAEIERAAGDGDHAAVTAALPDLEEAFSQAIRALESVAKEVSP
jgi:HPt (histidine-containing phosphotransfer) domain-containing protein